MINFVVQVLMHLPGGYQHQANLFFITEKEALAYMAEARAMHPNEHSVVMSLTPQFISNDNIN